MFISTIQSMASLPAFQASPIDTVVVAFEGFSLRSEAKQPIDSLADWKAACEQHGLKMAVNALKLFMEEEVDGLEHFLQALKDVDVDAIYYADEGVFEIAQRLGLQEKLVYQPETLVTNTPDVRFYLDLGVKSVSLAHELSLEEIVGIVQNCPQAEILIHGYFSILYSRRPLVTNYLRHIGKEKRAIAMILSSKPATKRCLFWKMKAEPTYSRPSQFSRWITFKRFTTRESGGFGSTPCF